MHPERVVVAWKQVEKLTEFDWIWTIIDLQLAGNKNKNAIAARRLTVNRLDSVLNLLKR